MNKQIIFLDIDGTLTEPGKNTPPDSALEAIRRAQAAGHLVFLCSGRNYGMLKPLLTQHYDGIISSSGGYVEVEGEPIYNHPMTREKQDRAMEVLRRNHIFCTIECKDGSYTDDGLKDFLRTNAGEGGNSELLRWREQLEQSLGIRSMSEYDGKPIYKIIMMATSMEDLVNARAELEGEFAFVVQESNGQTIFNGELVIPDYDKGQAIRRVCDFMHHPIEDTMGFGDSMNDLEMIDTVGTSICMANGSEELKRRSDDICPACTEDGLYHAFIKYNLI